MSHQLDGPALRAARHAAGLSQADVARRVGVSNADRVSQWEVGHASPHPRQLAALAEVLGVSVQNLLEPVGAGAKDLRRLRLEAGLSLEEVAATASVSPVTARRWEHGAGNPPTAVLAAILGVEEGVVRRAVEVQG